MRLQLITILLYLVGSCYFFVGTVLSLIAYLRS